MPSILMIRRAPCPSACPQPPLLSFNSQSQIASLSGPRVKTLRSLLRGRFYKSVLKPRAAPAIAF